MRKTALVAIFGNTVAILVGFSTPAFADTVYLTKDEALTAVLGTDCTITYTKREIPPDLLELLKAEDAEPCDSSVVHLFTCERDGTPTGYAIIDSQIGKHAPITYIVGISPAGKVTKTEIMVYRENYGSQVRESSFVRQFDDKELRDASGDTAMQVGREIRNISGATLSARAITKGVRRDLLVWNYFLGKEKRS